MSQAIDTNILVRFLTNDDPAQTVLAKAVLSKDFLLSATVLMETEWVLRASYRNRTMIASAFSSLLDLPMLMGVPDDIAWFLDRYAQGADFADMIHVSVCSDADAFATFDRGLVAAAGDTLPVAVRLVA